MQSNEPKEIRESQINNEALKMIRAYFKNLCSAILENLKEIMNF